MKNEELRAFLEEMNPWGPFETDESTGLPKLPEGLFFRVTRPLWGFWKVKLKRRVLGIFSYEVESRTYSTDNHLLNERAVVAGAEFALREYLESEARKKAGPKNDYSLVGNYPPKSLNKEK